MSLRDQLLKAGVVDKKQVNKAKQEKHKQVKQSKQLPKGAQVVDETKEAARQAMAEKAARDKEINLQRQAEADRRALRAQIVQLVQMNRIDRGKGDAAYQFSHDKKIKKVYLSDRLHKDLTNGLIALIALDSGYELVPRGVADKIRLRDESVIVVHNTRATTAVEEDDPYADFQIPDDLMW